MSASILKTKYQKVKSASSTDSKSNNTSKAILEISKMSLKFLTEECDTVKLISKVPGKNYFTFKKNDVFARPANKQYFIIDSSELESLWKLWQKGQLKTSEFSKLSYTVALAPSLAMEIFDRQNKKGPATYFECLIGHLFSRNLGINPTKRAQLKIKDKKVAMTMDFLFDLGLSKTKIHLPVKMSTRERVVQAWAHQRLLDSAYGVGTYKGIMVLFSETKLNSKSHEVVEICVPDQWLIYQGLLARMDRIYYFDPPKRYLDLTKKYPDVIVIKEFGEFFKEMKSVL